MGGLEKDIGKIQLILLWKGVFFGNFISAVCILLNFMHIAKDVNVNAQQATTYENYYRIWLRNAVFCEDIRFIVGSWSISPKPLLQSNRGSYNKQLVKVWKRFSVFNAQQQITSQMFQTSATSTKRYFS